MPITELRDAPWLKIRLTTPQSYKRTHSIVDQNQLNTVCVEAACPNRHECWTSGTATFMILGDTCTRKCGFCNVKSGKPPLGPDPQEPAHLADAVKRMNLKYVVITSVDRDDLADGGAQHWAECMDAIREANPKIRLEILTPDFKRCVENAIDILKLRAPFIWGHNVETVPELYRTVRMGSSYEGSLDLLRRTAQIHETIETKSSIMLGLGETKDQIVRVIRDLVDVGCHRMNIGQYLRPTREHLKVIEYHPPEYFDELKEIALDIGMKIVRSGPLVRSSYHAEDDGE